MKLDNPQKISGADKCSVKLALLKRWDTKGNKILQEVVGWRKVGLKGKGKEGPCSCPTQSKQRKIIKDADDIEVERNTISR